MSVLIKICGLKTPDALDVALEAGADMVGFVFFPASPRHVGYEAVRPLAARVRGPRDHARNIRDRGRCSRRRQVVRSYQPADSWLVGAPVAERGIACQRCWLGRGKADKADSECRCQAI